MLVQLLISLSVPATQKVDEKQNGQQRKHRQRNGKLSEEFLFVLPLLLPIIHKFFFFRGQHKKIPVSASSKNGKQRYRADSNCCRSFCRAQPSHSATVPTNRRLKTEAGQAINVVIQHPLLAFNFIRLYKRAGAKIGIFD